MKKLKKYIQEEIVNLQEKEYKAPPELLSVLKHKLRMDPLNRFIDKFKAVNTIPPSYRVFLLNGEYFDVYYESFSLLIKIGSKEYFIGDLDERNYAIKHINKLLTDPLLKSIGKDDEEEGGVPTPTPPKPPSSPPPPPAEEPEA